MGRAFNPNFGGLNHNVWLHLTGRIFQTFPLYENLRTTGVYAQNIDLQARTAEIHVEAQVRNDSSDFAAVALSTVVVDAAGIVRATFESDTSDLVHGQTEMFHAAGPLTGAHFWDVDDPYLYDVYYGVMIGQDRRTDDLATPAAVFRGYSAERRDRAPLIETEDLRDEALRSVWDDYSPPHFGFKKGPDDTWGWNSETFALQAARRYDAYISNRIDHPDPAHSKWPAYASIYWADSNADGRQQSSTVLRVSGKVDGMRLPKEAFYVYRVMQSAQPDLHIIGHWTYPAGTRKTMYVAATGCDTVELRVNGRSLGRNTVPTDGCVYAFPDVVFTPGVIRAVATRGGKVVAQQDIRTAGEGTALKLTAHVDPAGLQADGADVAFIAFEVVDARGHRCPTDEARVDFAVSGPAIWRGGLNSATPNSTNNLYLNTECGINRVAIRSTLTPGVITVTATRNGLTPATVKIASTSVEIVSGLMRALPPRLPVPHSAAQ
jgi:beta-galactosidase